MPTLRLAGLYAIAAVLAACVSAPDAALRPVTDGQPFTLRPGEQVRLERGRVLTYVGVGADSRCPPDAQCVWAGDATVELRCDDAALELHVGVEPRSVRCGRHALSVLALARGPRPAVNLLSIITEPSPAP